MIGDHIYLVGEPITAANVLGPYHLGELPGTIASALAWLSQVHGVTTVYAVRAGSVSEAMALDLA